MPELKKGDPLLSFNRPLIETLHDRQVHHQILKRASLLLDPAVKHPYIAAHFTPRDSFYKVTDMEISPDIGDSMHVLRTVLYTRSVEYIPANIIDPNRIFHEQSAKLINHSTEPLITRELKDSKRRTIDPILHLIHYIADNINTIVPGDLHDPNTFQQRYRLFTALIGFAQSYFIRKLHHHEHEISQRKKHNARDEMLGYILRVFENGKNADNMALVDSLIGSNVYD